MFNQTLINPNNIAFFSTLDGKFPVFTLKQRFLITGVRQTTFRTFFQAMHLFLHSEVNNYSEICLTQTLKGPSLLSA